MVSAIDAGPEAAEEFYKQWIAEVKRSVPEDRLLIFSPKEGWDPLCRFLDVPVPEIPFPRLNDSNFFKAYLKVVTIGSHLVVLGLPMLFGLLLSYFVISSYSNLA